MRLISRLAMGYASRFDCGHVAPQEVLAAAPADGLSRLLARRRLLIGWSTAALAGLQGCAGATARQGGRAIEVASGVYMLAGSGGAADEHNLGRIGNAGFIVGERGVVAIDTGTSYAHGVDLLAAIGEVTKQPVRVALISHTRPEFLFGGTAFRERGIPVRMHSSTARLMASRCETCLKTLQQTVGDQAMIGTTLYKADQTFEDSHALDLIGRPLRVLHFGHSSGPGDIAVLDQQTGILFAGGLLDANRIPDIQDSDLTGWNRALRGLKDMRIAGVVPGHGAMSAASLIGSVERYLAQLEGRARALVAAGTSLLSVSEEGELPEFESWDQYDTIHRRNASIAFLRFERDLMMK